MINADSAESTKDKLFLSLSKSEYHQTDEQHLLRGFEDQALGRLRRRRMADMQALSEFLQKGRANEVKELVQAALDEGVNAKEILEEGLMSGMAIIGDKFKKNEVFVPEVLIAARAMNAGTALLKPFLIDAGVKSKGTVVIGTVKGDLHDIGKNLVAMMMEGKGLTVIDLGTDVAPQQFIEKAIENEADIISCSALLTTTMTEMVNVVSAAKDAGIRDKVKIFIGGAPVTQSYCEKIEADVYSADAATAADMAVEVCGA